MDVVLAALHVIVGAGIVAGGVLGIARLCTALYRMASRIELIHDTVQRELIPNGGGALVDRVADCSDRLARVEQRLATDEA